MAEVEYVIQTDPETKKCTEFNCNTIWNCKHLGRNPQQGAHIRAFWASTVSFFLAFVGWFALAPIALDVAKSIDICENQLYPPLDSADNLKRKAFLKYKKPDTDEPYCTYGKNDDDDPTDCNQGDTIDATDVYNVDVLPGCVCSPGTECRQTIIFASLGSVGVTIAVRVALGTLLERFGPVNVQTGLMLFGSIWVIAASGISARWNWILIQTMIGCVGATFVTNQFWCSLMFAPRVVGAANATAAGWGNLGGGVTQILITGLFELFATAMDESAAWRVSMVVPGCVYIVIAVVMKSFCWDTPVGKRFTTDYTGKKTKASLWDYVECLKDLRVVVMIFQYSACFGTELAMNAQLATHFRTYFDMKRADAAVLASCFGLMNLFARAWGGILSDFLFRRFGFPGRLWAQFGALFFEGLFLLAFGFVDNSQEWYVALIVLICFSTFVQMAEGTSYGIVPFMIPEQLACVSALVGAGGNLGAVIALQAIYNQIDDELLPFRVHAGYVLFWAFTSVCFYWPDKGGLFCGPKEGHESKTSETPAVDPTDANVS